MNKRSAAKRVEHHATVSGVADREGRRADGADPRGSVETALSVAKLAESTNECPAAIEQLHTVTSVIADDQDSGTPVNSNVDLRWIGLCGHGCLFSKTTVSQRRRGDVLTSIVVASGIFVTFASAVVVAASTTIVAIVLAGTWVTTMLIALMFALCLLLAPCPSFPLSCFLHLIPHLLIQLRPLKLACG